MDERKSKRDETIPLPCFRVRLCGAFRVEHRIGSVYETVRTSEWGGSSYPRLLLKALLCCLGRQARREALIEMLWPDTDPEQAAQYLNTATTKLRKVLQPVKGQESLLLTEDDARFYCLEGPSLLWVDVDAAFVLLKEAEHLGRTSSEALPLLEEADTYFSQGLFLQDEEGSWAAGRRATVEQARYRCRLWLVDAYVKQGMPGQAGTTLSQLLEEDPTDEDVLCRLMLLFHKQEMTHQAIRLYDQVYEVFAKEGMEPAETTKNLVARLRENRRCSFTTLVENYEKNAVRSDCGTTQEERYYTLQNSADPLSSYGVATTIFKGFALLPGTDMHAGMPDKTFGLWADDLLAVYARGIATCQDLYFGGDPHYVEAILPLYCRQTTQIAQQHSPLQQSVARLASQAHQLACVLATDREDFGAAQQAGQLAFRYAQLAGDANLQVNALIGLANIGFHRKLSTAALRVYEHAVSLLDKNVTPLLTGRTYAGIAEVYAMRGQLQESMRAMGLAYEHYPLKPEEDSAYPYLRASRYSLYVFGDAQSRLFLGQPKEANQALITMLRETNDPEIEPVTKLDLLYYQAEVQIQQRELEPATTILTEAALLAKDLGSRLYFNKLAMSYRQLHIQWPREASVVTLEEVFQPW